MSTAALIGLIAAGNRITKMILWHESALLRFYGIATWMNLAHRALCESSGLGDSLELFSMDLLEEECCAARVKRTTKITISMTA
jgi:hypothetical protein